MAEKRETIELILSRAPDDPRLNDDAFLKELQGVSATFRAAGIEYSQRGFAMDGIDAQSFPLPEYIVVFSQAAVTAIAGVCGAWIQARYGRKARLKMGDLEAEARSPEEVQKLLDIAAKYEAAKATSKPATGGKTK